MIKKRHWVFLASALVLSPAWADNCDKKPTKDLRLMCEAAAQNNPRFCEDISSSSTRFDCLSYVKNKQFSLIWSFNSNKSKN